MGNTGTEEPRKPEAFFLIITEQKPKKPSIMSTLSYAWNVHGTFNGEFMSASGTTASVDGIAEVHGTAGEGGPFNHSSWIWGGFGHYGLGYIKGGHKENPTEKYPFHMTRHWRGEDGAHIWSSHHVTGAEGAWSSDVDVIAEYFQPEGPIMKGLINGQYPSHWIATKRSDKEVDVWAPSPLKSRVVARTPPTFTSTCSFTSPASQSTATTGSWSTSLLSTTPTTGTTRSLLLLILTGPLAMSPQKRLSPGT